MNDPSGPKTARSTWQGRLVLLAASAAGLPLIAAVVLLIVGDWPGGLATLVGVLLLLWVIALLVAVKRQAVEPLRSLVNLLEAVRLGDYGLRGRSSRADDVLGEVYAEVNTLSASLRDQRLVDTENASLLAHVMSNIDVAVMTFDDEQSLQLANAAAESLLRAGRARLAGLDAKELALERYLKPGLHRIEDGLFGATGRFSIRCAVFRVTGRPAYLLTLTDLSASLREEERRAWRRIIRVIGHEINNSLVPIMSMSSTWRRLLDQGKAVDRAGLVDSLDTIERRATSLQRLMKRFSEFAKLPDPVPRSVAVRSLIERAAQLVELGVVAAGHPDSLRLQVDPDQFDLVMINLLRNAREAGADAMEIRWRLKEGWCLLELADNGSGPGASDNIFTPFFSTKPGGSGIGLVLCRQIVEAHGGRIQLTSSESGGGLVTVRLPVPGGQ